MTYSFVAEASRIGDFFLESSGWEWSGLNRQNSEDIIGWTETHRSGLNIYSGAAGIVLFLLHLYRQTGESKYKAAVVQGLTWLTSQNMNAADMSLLTGLTGICHVLMNAAEIIGDDRYRQLALSLMLKQGNSVNPSNGADYMTGFGGALLGLTLLHAKLEDECLLRQMEAQVAPLLARSVMGPNGIFWHSGQYNQHGLCGFSHGASGVGLALLELGHYLGNEAYLYLARQAFAYEACYYDREQGSWPDFRLYLGGEYHAGARDALLGEDWKHFTRRPYRNSWCQGAPGVGLVRLRAFQLLGDNQYLLEAEGALRRACRLFALPRAEYSGQDGLCHGSAGNAELLLEAGLQLGNESYFEVARGVGQSIIDYRRLNGHYLLSRRDPALFDGITGIGYFMLRLADPKGVPSILCPRPEGRYTGLPEPKCFPNLFSSTSGMRGRILGKVFPRTLHMLRLCDPDGTQAWLAGANDGEREKAAFIDYARTCCERWRSGKLSTAERRLADVLKLEESRIEVSDSVASRGLLVVKNKVKIEMAEPLFSLTDEELAATVLATDPDLSFCATFWPWPLVEPSRWAANLEREAEESTVLLLPHPLGVVEEKVPALPAHLLRAFTRPKRVTIVIKIWSHPWKSTMRKLATKPGSLLLARLGN